MNLSPSAPLSSSKNRKVDERTDDANDVSPQGSTNSNDGQQSGSRQASSSATIVRPMRHDDNDDYHRNNHILHLRKERKWEDILMLYEQEWESYSNKNYSHTIVAISRARTFDNNNPKFRSFLNDLVSRVENEGYEWLGNLQMGNVLESIGKMGLTTPTVKRLLYIVQSKDCSKWIVDKGQTQTVANVAWALARLNCHAEIFFEEVNRQAEWLTTEGNAQDIASVVWACGMLQIRYCPNIFDFTEKNAQYICEKGRPLSIARVMWTCAKLNVHLPNFFRQLERNVGRLKRGKPQDLVKCVWACATMGNKKSFPNLFAEIEEQPYWITNSEKVQNISNTAWACAKLGIKAPKFFDLLNARAEHIVQNGRVQEIVNCAWACASLDYKATRLFFEANKHASFIIVGKTESKCGGGIPQNATTLAWSCATLRIHAPKVFEALERKANWICTQGNAQDLGNAIWSCALMGFGAPNLFSGVAQRADWLIERQQIQDLLHICYAFVVADVAKTHEKTFHKMWNTIIDENPHVFDNDRLNEIAQVEAFARVDGINLRKLPHALQSRIDISKALTVDDDIGLHFQKEISILLARVGFEHEEEISPLSMSLSGGLLSIDMGCRQRKVAIECDGPTHYLIDAETGDVTYNENGPTIAKRRFLERSGWTVINLNYQDRIKAFNGGYDEKWLLERLLAAGVKFESRIVMQRTDSDSRRTETKRIKTNHPRSAWHIS